MLICNLKGVESQRVLFTCADAELLAAYTMLNAEDLANAWNYARSHREEMDSEIAANGDEA